MQRPWGSTMSREVEKQQGVQCGWSRENEGESRGDKVREATEVEELSRAVLSNSGAIGLMVPEIYIN